ncbi:hypothetical protein ROZALSC1DRAFT_27290 [Rozella allomycis CSF55]|uniref:Uncharacterized protein n=1 Tax=Rozella allomycis (strain CSF55) TaxID=988480 RepID=A0A4P9YNW2_ROZAC|nr:hypothetical protein ROZALSC1DRAFT_27290 [Rozella allomycis CSF55]
MNHKVKNSLTHLASSSEFSAKDNSQHSNAIDEKSQKPRNDKHDEIIQKVFFSERCVYSKFKDRHKKPDFGIYKLPSKQVQSQVAKCVMAVQKAREIEDQIIKDLINKKKELAERNKTIRKIAPKECHSRLHYFRNVKESSMIIHGQPTALRALRFEKIVSEMPFRREIKLSDALKKLPKLSLKENNRLEKLLE